MIYLDSSAIVKLAHREAETDALRMWLGANPATLISSSLARTETVRALRRTAPSALPTLAVVLATMNTRPVSDSLLDAAAALPGPHLRSLDAIHLATALELSSLLGAFVAYDGRLAAAAKSAGLVTVSPS